MAAAPAFSRQQGQTTQPAAQAAAAYGQESWNGGDTVARSAPARPASPQRAEAYAAQPELGDQGSVALDVLALEVLEEPAAAPDHLQQPAPGGVVVLVGLEVLRQLGDPCGEHRDLDVGRAGIAVRACVLLDDPLLGFFGQRHG